MSWERDHGDCDARIAALEARIAALLEDLEAAGIAVSDDAHGAAQSYRLVNGVPTPVPHPWENGGAW
ncbi:hypothetical protein [Microbacterium capsulatum]|uniref:Uncharacterized protein n=1 Tax=Microbacterium capsulatum TaxID=3041921 RepID=A0ABU0XFJ7_9MICO|nr:hypothetical protein [Microbacterium sp. ASV81]MDQ4212465.1 hypothetical protein [Microbacterium sp. ASV81]